MRSHTGINFHYVGMPDYPYPGIYSLTPDTFRNHLLELGRSCNFISLPQLLNALKDGSSLPENACLITFDDGLACQYAHALPVLDDLNCDAAFFISGDVYASGRGLQVHRIHWTRACLGDDHIRERIGHLVKDGLLDKHPDEVDTETALVGNYYDAPAQARLKYYLNYLLKEEEVDLVLDRLFEDLGATQETFLAEYYMTGDMLKELGKRGMLGSHGMSHRPLSPMSPDQMTAELIDSKSLIEAITGTEIEAISYPFGTKDAVSIELGSQATATGYRLGYTMEHAVNEEFSDPLLFARIDAKAIAEVGSLPSRSLYR